MNKEELRDLFGRHERNEGAYLTVERLNGSIVERAQSHKDVGALIAVMTRIAALVPSTRPYKWVDTSGELRSVDSCGICGCSGSCSANCPSAAMDFLRTVES